jgi:cytochrome oxidase Cu insertion factor (SCO1/SenC/PrrC family)
MISKILLVLICAVIAATSALAQTTPAVQPSPAPQPAPQKTHLKVGQPAPDFSLRATDGKTYKLSDFRGKKNVVLAAYVLAFTGG